MLPERASLLRFATSGEELAGTVTVELPTVCVHTNAGAVDDGGITRSRLQGLYHARVVRLDPIRLVALSPGSMVIGSHSYLLLTDGVLIEDQIWPGVHDSPEILARLLKAPLGVVQVDQPVLLVARWGAVSVWGHWLGELLPKVVMVEAAYPGRFRYAIPADILRRTGERSFSTAVLESLAAYGIGEDRLLPLDHQVNHRFRQLFALTPAWSHVALHPAALAALRSGVLGVPRSISGPRLGLLRRDVTTRHIANADEVAELLGSAGFQVVEMAPLPFVEQVAAFREAEEVAGVLGSGLTGLIYSPEGVRVLSVAPANWRDVFFHALIQARGGLYADVLGTPLWTGEGVDRDAPFFLRRRDLLAALDRMARPEAELAPEGVVALCGLVLPRRLQPVLAAIDFRTGAETRTRVTDGWAEPEAEATWTLGPQSRVSLALPPSTGPLMLEMVLSTSLAPPHLVSRPLAVSAGGVELGVLVVAAGGTYDLSLPRSCLGDGLLELEFRHALTTSPRDLGMSGDERAISISFHALRVRGMRAAGGQPS